MDERNEMPADNWKELKNGMRGGALLERILEFPTTARKTLGVTYTEKGDALLKNLKMPEGNSKLMYIRRFDHEPVRRKHQV
ncbi:MAG: hypothetical protein LLF84_02310 [Methanoregulaceae archaeon]|nr:hypothetical protein [Methanoregulaceae archaeon]